MGFLVEGGTCLVDGGGDGDQIPLSGSREVVGNEP